MTFRRDTASSRPARQEHGFYTVVSSIDTEQESSSAVDASEALGSHRVKQVETLKTVLDPVIGETAIEAALPGLSTGYAVKHGDIEGRSILL